MAPETQLMTVSYFNELRVRSGTGTVRRRNMDTTVPIPVPVPQHCLVYQTAKRFLRLVQCRMVG